MNEIFDKVVNKISLTDEEVYKFLKFNCDFIRNNTDIIDPMDYDCKWCDETSLKFISAMVRFDSYADRINIKEYLEIPLTHYFNVISLNVNNEIKTYLVDMTFSQFFADTITLDNQEVVSTEVFKNLEQELWVENLRKNGFIEANNNFLEIYKNLFIDLCNTKRHD